MFYLNGVMFLCIYMVVCLCLIVFAVRREWTAIHFRASRNRRSSFGGQMIQFFEFYEIEDPEHLFGEGKCPLTYLYPIHSLIHLLHFTVIPKD
jgi:NADH:ubiquinone oxidoreductase subunit H